MLWIKICSVHFVLWRRSLQILIQDRVSKYVGAVITVAVVRWMTWRKDFCVIFKKSVIDTVIYMHRVTSMHCITTAIWLHCYFSKRELHRQLKYELVWDEKRWQLQILIFWFYFTLSYQELGHSYLHWSVRVRIMY